MKAKSWKNLLLLFWRECSKLKTHSKDGRDKCKTTQHSKRDVGSQHQQHQFNIILIKSGVTNSINIRRAVSRCRILEVRRFTWQGTDQIYVNSTRVARYRQKRYARWLGFELTNMHAVLALPAYISRLSWVCFVWETVHVHSSFSMLLILSFAS